jgi:hypothetical protein
VECEQVEQIFIGSAGLHGKAAHLRVRGRQVADRAQARDVAEQLFDRVAQFSRPRKRPDFDLELTRLARRRTCHGRSGNDHSGRCRGGTGCRGGCRRGGCHGPCSEGANATHQFVRGHGRPLLARLVAREQAAHRVCSLEQHIDHFRYRLQFVAAQTVEQGLHLVRELGHVGEAESGCTALDRMRTTEDAVEFFVVRALQVQVQQDLLELVEVFARLFEKDLVELAQIEIRAGTRCFMLGLRHGGSCVLRYVPGKGLCLGMLKKRAS